MNHIFWPFMALMAGAAIATQASFNAQLGVILKNPLLASSVAFCSSLIFTLVILVTTSEDPLPTQQVREVPFYLWFIGGLFSTFGVASFYWLIPKMGIGPVLSYALSGQLLLAILAGHFGWFNLPTNPISALKMLGVGALIGGIVLINRG